MKGVNQCTRPEVYYAVTKSETISNIFFKKLLEKENITLPFDVNVNRDVNKFEKIIFASHANINEQTNICGLSGQTVQPAPLASLKLSMAV